MDEDNHSQHIHRQTAPWEDGFAWEVIEALGQGVTVVGVDDRFEYVNHAFAQMVGRSPDALIGLTPLDVIHPDDHKTLQQANQQRGAGEQSTYETRLVRPDGTIVHAHVTGSPRWREGKVVGAYAIVTDLTEHKQAEQELKAEQQFIQRIFNANPNILYIFDLDEQQIVFQNQLVGVALGYTVEENREMGINVLPRLAHPDDLPHIANHFAQLQTAVDDDILEIEYRLHHADNSWRWFASRNTIFKRKPDGRVQEIIGTATDITDQKQAEADLQAKQAELAGIIGSAMDAIISIDESQHVVLFNEAAAQMFGCPATEAMGQPLERFIPERFRASHRSHIQRFSQAGVTNRKMGHLGTLWALRAGGQEFPIEASISQVKVGEETLYTVILRDIAERKQAEERQRYQALLLKSISDATITTDLDFTIQSWNNAAEALYGWRAEEAVGQKMGDLVPTHYPTLRSEQASAQFQAEGRWQGEVIQQHKDGHSIHVLASVTLVRDEAGQPISVLAVNRDITERKQVEKQLRESEEKYAAIFAKSPFAIALTKASDSTIVNVNDAYLKLFEFSRSEVIGKTSLELGIADPDTQAQIAAELQAQGHVSNFDAVRFTKSGTRRVLSLSVDWVSIGGERHLLTTARDITERKEAMAALHESEEKLRLFIEHAPASLAMFDREMCYLSHSHRWLIDYSLGDQSIIGRSHYEVLPEIPDRRKEIHRRGLAGDIIKTDEDQFVRLDGTIQWLRWEVRPWYKADDTIGGIVIFTEDITGRKQTEATLVELQDILAAAESVAKIGSWKWDLHTQKITWSDEMFALFGVDRESFEGDVNQIINTRIHPDDIEMVNQANLAVLEAHEPSPLEYRIVLPDGTERLVWAEGKITYDRSGQPTALVGYVQDITERKQTEQALRQSEARYQAIVEDQTELIMRSRADGTILYANEAYSRLFGRRAEELIGQNFLSLLDKRERDIVQAKLDRLTAENPVEINEYAKTLPDGYTHWLRWTDRGIFDDNGRLIEVQAAGYDITLRREAEERLRQSEAQLQHIIDTVPEGVFLLDAEFSVRLTNPVADKYLAILAPEWENGRLNQLGERPLHDFLTSPPQGLWHEIAIDDHTFEAIARSVEDSPINTGWVLVLRDVTQSREIQQRVQQQERLAAVGQLASGIAHDFNNIMAVITLYAQLLFRTLEMPTHAQEKLHTIEQQAGRATDLIQQILDFSRQSVLKWQPLDLLPFTKELVKLLERTLPEHIQIEPSYAEEAFIIEADPSRIQQVIMNLAVNARDAMPEGGRLQISLAHLQTGKDKPLTVGVMPPGDWIQIEIADNGSGIPSEVLPQIFEPFFTTKEIGQGTGLGLPQVYGIMQQHEGYINVTTKLRQGTTFTLYFPVFRTEKGKTDRLDKASLSLGRGQRILLVEDDPAIRQALLDSLMLLNYGVVEAENGREALNILATKADKIDLILSDVVMPEMGGIALLHAIREQKLTIPIVLLTGHPLSREMENLQSLGLAGWLLKPPNLINLSQLLAQTLAEQASTDGDKP